MDNGDIVMDNLSTERLHNMKNLRAGALLLGLFLITARAAEAEKETILPKEAQEVIRKAEALQSYRAKFTLEAKEEEGKTFRLRGTMLFQKPQQRWLEIYEADAQEPSQILIADGKTEWQYYPQNSVVYRALNPPPPPGPHRPFAEAQPGTLRFIRLVEEGGQKRLRFEAEPLPSMKEGAPVPIQKMRIEVGEKDGLARKLELLDSKGQSVLTQSFTEVEINVAVDKNRFSFVPQEGVAVMDLPVSELGIQPGGKRS